MHIDLHSLLIRPMGVGPNALNGTGAAQKRLQPIVERGLEVQLGARQRDLTYGPAGLFMSAAAAASREAAAALGTDRDARTPVAGSADGNDGADGAEGFAGDAGAVQRVAAPRDEAAAGGDTSADAGESADVPADDGDQADPDGLATLPDTTGDGGVQDAMDGGEDVPFDELADSLGNPFLPTTPVGGADPAPEEATAGAADDAAAVVDETEAPVNWGDAYAEDTGTVDMATEAESAVAEPVAEEAPEIADATAEPVVEEAAEEAYADAAGEAAPSTPPAWAAMADVWAEAEAGESPAPTLDLVA